MKKRKFFMVLFGFVCLLFLRIDLVQAEETKISQDGLWQYQLTYDYDTGSIVASNVACIHSSYYDEAFESWVEPPMLPETITLPKTIDGYVVTSLSDSAFRYIENGGKDIKIEADIEKIPWRCFENSSSIKCITLPETVQEIENSAFEGCTGLETINLPESIKTIDYDAFQNCTSLKTIHLPSKVTYIDESAFQNCCNLTDIYIPKYVTYIGKSAFEGCKNLKEIKFPDYIEYIGEKAFSGCNSISKITLPVTIREIGNYAFCDCTNLEQAAIYRGRDIKLGKKIFARCKSSFVLTGTEKGKIAQYANSNSYQFSKLQDKIKNDGDIIKLYGTATAYHKVESTVNNDEVASVSDGRYVDTSPYKAYIKLRGNYFRENMKKNPCIIKVKMLSGLECSFKVQIMKPDKEANSIKSVDDTIILSVSGRNYYSGTYLRLYCLPLGTEISGSYTYKYNHSIIEVDKYGNIKAKNPGETILTVTKKKKTAKIKIIVME